MRGTSVMVLLVIAGCDLYFGPHHQQGPDARLPDGRPRVDAETFADASLDAGPASYTFAACADGVVHRSAPQATDVAPADIATAGDALATCPGRCRAAGDVYECLGDAGCPDATTWLCEPDLTCPTSATCSGSATRSCSAGAGCAIDVTTESCACTGGAEVCSDPCTDGLCSPVQILHALAGHWQGTVDPPSFSNPYQVDIVIAPDGHVSPHRSWGYGSAFYYGDDGPAPGRYFHIVGAAPTGAVGLVGIPFGSEEILPGLVTGLHVDDRHLSFRFWDSWLDCTRPFDFRLTRVP